MSINNEQAKKSLKNLSVPSSWNQYHDTNSLESSIPNYLQRVMKKEMWRNTPGAVFELGCGSSKVLAICAQLGWEVWGIDFNESSILALNRYLMAIGVNKDRIGQFICENVCEYDWGNIKKRFDYVISFGFLEHFAEPSDILKKISTVLLPEGKVLSMIPNLQSFNGRLMKRYDRDLWSQHVEIKPIDLDEIHRRAGMAIVKPAFYTGGADIDMLFPWDKIRKRVPLQAYRLLRYCFFCIAWISSKLLYSNSRLLNPVIYGVYAMPRSHV